MRVTDRIPGSALRESEERQAFLLKLSDALRSLDDALDIQREAIRLLREQLGADRVTYWEVIENGQAAVALAEDAAPALSSFVGRRQDFTDFERSEAEGLHRGEPAGEEDVQADAALSPEQKESFAANRIMRMPVLKSNRLVAYLVACFDAAHRWTSKDVDLLRETAERTWDAVERHAVEEALRASEQKYRSLADAVPQLIWANDGAGQANYFNRRWYDYTGLSFEESFGPGWQAVVHPDDAPGSVEDWRRALAAGEAFDAEYRLRGADGSYRWFIGRNVPARDVHDRITGWFGTATDIEDLKQAEQALRESQERLRLMLENAREYAIFSMDLSRHITSWNTGAQAMLGYVEEEAIGKSADVIFTPEDRARGGPQLEAAKALGEGRAADERWHVRKDGTRFWGSGVMTAMHDANGHALGLLKIFRDQTAELYVKEALEQSRKRMVEALHEAEQARSEAEAAGQAKDQFLAVLSHELRTPLTPVMVATRMLDKRSDLPVAGREAIAMIRRNVELEAHFVDDLLDITRIARGKMELATSPMDVHDAVLRAVEITRSDIDAKGLAIDVNLEAQRHNVNGDAARLQQVFWNLLGNAAKFTPQGGRIHVRSHNESNFIVVEIEDTGIGIDASVLPRLFQPFTQADAAITRQFGGLGLGLAIAKATVQGHGGEIRASSEGSNRGATFYVRLPLLEAA